MEPVNRERCATLAVDSLLSLIDTSKMPIPENSTFELERQKLITHAMENNLTISDQQYLARIILMDFYRKGETILSALESREPIPFSKLFPK